MFASFDAQGRLLESFHTDDVSELEADLSKAHERRRIIFDGDVSLLETEREDNAVTVKTITAEDALRHVSLSPVADSDVTGLSVEKAHERLRRLFSSKEYQTPSGLVRNLLGSNGKHDHGSDAVVRGVVPPSVSKGLFLLPFDLYVSRAPAIQRNRDLKGLPQLPQAPMDALGTCAGSTKECRASCLVFSNNNERTTYGFIQPLNAKAERSAALFSDPPAFCRILEAALAYEATKAAEAGLAFFPRLNNFSDLPWEAIHPGMFRRLAGKMRFYDYTKVDGRAHDSRRYDLTFSYAGTKASKARTARWYDKGGRIAVVFAGLPRKAPLTDLTFDGHPVIDGAQHDFRPLDPRPAVVGLRWIPPAVKGAKSDDVFVVRVQPGEQKGTFITACTPRVLAPSES